MTKGTQNLNDTKKKDIIYVFSYLKRENAKKKKWQMSEGKMKKPTADMLRVSRSCVYDVLSGVYLSFLCTFY